MKVKNIIILLFLLMVFSCFNRILNSEQKTENLSKKELIRGLRIESGPPQGMRQIDSLGNTYGFTTITSIITNNSINPIHFEIALMNEYEYSTPHGKRKYKVILLPDELTPDSATLFNPYKEEIGNFLDQSSYNTPYALNKTLDPNEICVVTIGTLRPSCKSCGVIPNSLFTTGEKGEFSNCDWLIKESGSLNSQFNFWLKIGLSEGCKIIPCGKILYPKE